MRVEYATEKRARTICNTKSQRNSCNLNANAASLIYYSHYETILPTVRLHSSKIR